MKQSQKWVIQSAVLGSFCLVLFAGFVVPAQATLQEVPPLLASPESTTAGDQQAGHAGRRGTEACAVNPRYPPGVLRWCELITRYAEENHLSPDLVAAVMLQESGGQARAYSHSGAVGLMQVMPRDGLAARFECVNGPCFASRPTIRELEDPEFNVAYGVRLLSGLVTRHGEVREALRAYGPMDVGYSYADRVIAIWERYGG